jgi:hypothetical protein
MNFDVHFKFDKKRGLCMTQVGGSLHYAISDFHPSVAREVTECLNECYNKWVRSRLRLEKLESQEGGAALVRC